MILLLITIVSILFLYLSFYIVMIIFLKKEEKLNERINNLFLELFKKTSFKNEKERKEYEKSQKRRIKRINNLRFELNKLISKIEFLNNIPFLRKL